MRHVFVAYSGITRLATLATINALGLSDDDVAVFIGRYERPMAGYRNHYFHDLLRLGRNVPKFRKQLRDFNRQLTDIANGDEMAVYLPGLFTEHFYTMATHPSVVSVNFIEEGIGSLTSSTRVYARRRGGDSWLANLAAWRDFPPNGTDCRELVDRCFHFTPEAFPDWPSAKKVAIPWPHASAPTEYMGLGFIISIEAVVEAGHATLYRYSQEMAKLAEQLQERTSKPLGMKFHPNVSEVSEASVRTAIEERANAVRVIPRDVTLEAMFGPESPLLVGAVTSSMHYAVTAGGRAASYAHRLGSASLDARCAKLLAQLPMGTRQQIGQL